MQALSIFYDFPHVARRHVQPGVNINDYGWWNGLVVQCEAFIRNTTNFTAPQHIHQLEYPVLRYFITDKKYAGEQGTSIAAEQEVVIRYMERSSATWEIYRSKLVKHHELKKAIVDHLFLNLCETRTVTGATTPSAYHLMFDIERRAFCEKLLSLLREYGDFVQSNFEAANAPPAAAAAPAPPVAIPVATTPHPHCASCTCGWRLRTAQTL